MAFVCRSRLWQLPSWMSITWPRWGGSWSRYVLAKGLPGWRRGQRVGRVVQRHLHKPRLHHSGELTGWGSILACGELLIDSATWCNMLDFGACLLKGWRFWCFLIMKLYSLSWTVISCRLVESRCGWTLIRCKSGWRWKGYDCAWSLGHQTVVFSHACVCAFHYP